MAALSLSLDALRPMNRWNHDSIRPGIVGSVGDVNMTPKFKHSMPDAPLRFDPYFSGREAESLGSNVQNGDSKSFDSHGKTARTIDSNWGGRRHFKINRGWVYQDMRVPDKLTEPVMGGTPNYMNYNRIATTYNAKRTGDKFLPLPGGFAPTPGLVTRGGAMPIIRDREEGTVPYNQAPTPENISQFRLANEQQWARRPAIKNLKPRRR